MILSSTDSVSKWIQQLKLGQVKAKKQELQGAGSEVEKPGLELALTWDASVRGASLIHCDTVPAPADTVL